MKIIKTDNVIEKLGKTLQNVTSAAKKFIRRRIVLEIVSANTLQQSFYKNGKTS